MFAPLAKQGRSTGPVALLQMVLALLAIAGIALPSWAKESAAPYAVTATVAGDKIQKVGFRAMVQRLAIQHNLAGFVRNGPDGTVEVRLEGPRKRVDAVIEAMREGSRKSSQNNDVRQSPAAPTAGLNSFTIQGWTSVSRKISTPYDLVFQLRADGRTISRKAAKEVWNRIALATLKGDDLAKFKARLDEE